jgi:hypothetical protein
MDIEDIEILKPRTNTYLRIISKMQKLIQQGNNDPYWSENYLIASLFYLYLFNKYNMNCVIPAIYVTDYMPIHGFIADLRTKKLVSIDSEYYAIQDEAEQMVLDSIIRCIESDIKTIVIPYSIILDGTVISNLLVYRKINHALELFQPYSPEDIEPWIIKASREIAEGYVQKINKKIRNPIKFIDIEVEVPIFSRFRDTLKVEGLDMIFAWNLFFTELVLQNPSVRSAKLIGGIYRYLNTKRGENFFTEMIRGYINIITEKLIKYFTLILGHNPSPLEITRIIDSKDPFRIRRLHNSINYLIYIESNKMNMTPEKINMEKQLKYGVLRNTSDPFEKILREDEIRVLDNIQSFYKNDSPIEKETPNRYKSSSSSSSSSSITRKKGKKHIAKKSSRKNVGKATTVGKAANVKKNKFITNKKKKLSSSSYTSSSQDPLEKAFENIRLNNMKQSPDKMKQSPDKMKQSPDKMKQSPDKMKQSPDKMKDSSDESLSRMLSKLGNVNIKQDAREQPDNYSSEEDPDDLYYDLFQRKKK